MKCSTLRLIATAVLLSIGASNTASAVQWPPVLDPDTNVQPPKWDWQLKSPVQLNDDASIEIYDIDMFDNESNGMVNTLQSYGKKVICYVNVGAWEDFRDDDLDFPRSILGNVYDRFPNEKWLDIRDVNPLKSTTGTALAAILEARFDRALQMGCDAVEPDNIDGFDETSHNPSGFPLTYEDQMYFNLWVAREVRKRGMLIGFKNNTNQALDPRSVEAFDFVVTESCVYFDECQYFNGFLAANKPVFLTEYLSEPEDFCPTAKNYRISGIKKRGSLDTYRLNCDSYYDNGPITDPTPDPDPTPVATNLLANGGFESGLVGWQSCADASNLSISDNASEGNNAAAISGISGCLYQEANVAAGESYTLSCDASRPGTPWSIIQFSYLDSQYNALQSDTQQVAQGGGYSNYEFVSTAPANTTYALALIYSEDQMLIDNCVLSNQSDIEPEPQPEPEPEPQPEPEPTPVVSNLLFNGGFESGLSNWQSCGNADNLNLNTNAAEGAQALEIIGGAGCLYQEVTVNVGQSHTLTCEAQRPSTPWSIVQLSYLDSQYNALLSNIAQIATSNSYATYSVPGTAPSNTSFAVALIYSEDQTLVDNCVLSLQ